MLKIKDSVDLKELEKFGYGYYDSIQAIYPRHYLKIIDNSHLIEIERLNKLLKEKGIE